MKSSGWLTRLLSGLFSFGNFILFKCCIFVGVQPVKPWQVKETLKLYRGMSGSESVRIGMELSDAAVKIFASSLGKKPGREVYDILWRENEWLSRKLREMRLRR